MNNNPYFNICNDKFYISDEYFYVTNFSNICNIIHSTKYRRFYFFYLYLMKEMIELKIFLMCYILIGNIIRN